MKNKHWTAAALSIVAVVVINLVAYKLSASSINTTKEAPNIHDFKTVTWTTNAPIYFVTNATPVEYARATFSTNTFTDSISGDNSQTLADKFFAQYSPDFRAKLLPPPTERWQVDTTIQREIATFTWRGQSTALTYDKVLRIETNWWKLEMKWEKQP
jgi:hypothetical protein